MGCVPELRFKEFNDEWEEKKIDDCLKILGGASFKSTDSVKNGIKWLKIANVGLNKINVNEISYLPEKFNNNYKEYLLKKGDVVLALTRPILNHQLKIAIINEFFNNSLLNQRVGKVNVKKDNNLKFFFYLIQLHKNISFIENMISGSDPPNLSNKEFLRMNVNVPSLEEQEKISNFLSKIDEKIDILEDKLQLWENYKKRIMQQLFSQELRFKDDDGNSFPDWEEKKFGNLFKEGKAGGTPKSTETKYYNGNIPFLSIADMTSQGKYISSTEKMITEGGLNNSSAWVIPENNLLYSIYASVGSVAINKVPMSTSQAIFGIILKNDINIEYIYYYLLDYKKYIHKLIETGTQGNLNSKIVNELIINLPSYKEQIKISNILINIDNRVNEIYKEIVINKKFKKGLLQKMFVNL